MNVRDRSGKLFTGSSLGQSSGSRSSRLRPTPQLIDVYLFQIDTNPMHRSGLAPLFIVTKKL